MPFGPLEYFLITFALRGCVDIFGVQIQFKYVEWKTTVMFSWKKCPDFLWCFKSVLFKLWVEWCGKRFFFFLGRFISFCCNYWIRASVLSIRQWMLQSWTVDMWLANTKPGWAGSIFHLLQLWAASTREEVGWFG